MAANPNPINGLLMFSSSPTELPLPSRRLFGLSTASLKLVPSLNRTSVESRTDPPAGRERTKRIHVGIDFAERGPNRMRQF